MLHRFFRLNMPVISKYACTDKTGKLAPAKIKGFPKSAKDSIKRTSMVLAIPGTDNGRVTFVNTCHLDAFRLNAASSSVGDIVDSTPSKVMNATGKKVITWAIIRPPEPYTGNVRIPNSFEVIRPLKPKSIIIDIAPIKGGKTIGTIAMVLKKIFEGYICPVYCVGI